MKKAVGTKFVPGQAQKLWQQRQKKELIWTLTTEEEEIKFERRFLKWMDRIGAAFMVLAIISLLATLIIQLHFSS